MFLLFWAILMTFSRVNYAYSWINRWAQSLHITFRISLVKYDWLTKIDLSVPPEIRKTYRKRQKVHDQCTHLFPMYVQSVNRQFTPFLLHGVTEILFVTDPSGWWIRSEGHLLEGWGGGGGLPTLHPSNLQHSSLWWDFKCVLLMHEPMCFAAEVFREQKAQRIKGQKSPEI